MGWLSLVKLKSDLLTAVTLFFSSSTCLTSLSRSFVMSRLFDRNVSSSREGVEFNKTEPVDEARSCKIGDLNQAL